MKRTKNFMRDLIAQELIKNEENMGTPLYKSYLEIADKYKMSRRTVYRIRRILIDEKKILETVSANTMWGEKSRPTITVEETRKLLEGEDIMPSTERLKTLSRLIRIGAPLIKIAAIKALEDMTRASDGQVGPPIPLTDDLRQSRLARLMMATGQETTDAAYSIAFGTHDDVQSSTEAQAEVQSDPGSVPPDVPPSEGPLPDLPPTDSSPPGS